MGKTEEIFLSIGSNLGNREANLQQAIKKLEGIGLEISNCSAIFRTIGWGSDSLQEFLNMVLEVQYDSSPQRLLKEIKMIEKNMGRSQNNISPNGQRTYLDRIIDIDILYFGQKVIDSEKLSLPHPQMHLRRFVLEPLREIAPHFVHPLLKKTSIELYELCSDQNKVELHS